jgi:riboflavin synthase
VECLGRIEAVIPEPPGVLLRVVAAEIAEGLGLGDSIAIDGCCLTVVGVAGDRLDFQAGEETLSKTTLGRRGVGDPVNLERSLRVQDRMGGHFVTGHIDGVGEVVERTDDGPWSRFVFSASRPLMLQMASKGSIAVDGVSLTLVDVLADRFSVALIPHTLQVTTLGRRRVGDAVNLETDLLAKYVQRQLAGGDVPDAT